MKSKHVRARTSGPGLEVILLVAVLMLAASSASSAAERIDPPPAPPIDSTAFGRNFQRTMGLLASSSPERRNRVKILFYGQSIAAASWWRDVAADLRARFPDADLEIVNRAIGGFSVQKLHRVAEHDVMPYYPDLVLFHVYGAHTVYEDLIREIRRRTTAEIAIWTDHLGGREKPDLFGVYRDRGWARFMAGFLPALATEYDCGLIEIREPWKAYLLTNDLEAGDLLVDDIHLNERGGRLMAALIGRQLVYRPDLGLGPSAGLVTDYQVGTDVSWQGDRLELAFEGNRVDLIPAPGTVGPGALEVRVDGRRPSEFPGVYAHTRPSVGHGRPGPGILRVGFESRPLLEDWVARIVEVDSATGVFRFEVIGSRTGPDGMGRSDEDFISESGRVVIRAHVQPRGVEAQTDWRMERDVPVGYEIRWETTGVFADRYAPPPILDTTREHASTIVQGIPNRAHTLTLESIGETRPALRAIRVYRPPIGD